MRKTAIILIVILLSAAGAYFAYSRIKSPTNSSLPETKLNQNQLNTISVVAENLDTPWSITVLPGARLMVTERSGIVRIIGSDNRQFQIADVIETSEGGLLGLTIAPNYEDNGYVYIYKTTGSSNIVERYRLKDNELIDRTDILTGIPAAPNHNGGAIKFGPDGKLYITTGDAQVENLAQDRGSLAGKILRINSDGTVPADNPFGNKVWSYGHRNPQGLTWDNQARLWSSEHGPSGLQSGNDELNLIQKGGNYGWPVIRGNQTREGMIAPIIESGTGDTWAPAGLAYADDSLYFTGLRGQTLYKARINGDAVQLSRHLVGTYGRLRAVTAQDNTLLISTSNRDGRGTPKQGDDKLLRVPLKLL